MEEQIKLPIFSREKIYSPHRFRTGIAKLDECIGGGIPSSLVVAVLNDPENDVSTFCQQFCWQGLKDSEVAIYFAYDQHPGIIRQNMAMFGWNTSNFERTSDFIIVDCFSARTGERSGEKYWIEKPFDRFSVLNMFRELEKEIRLERDIRPVRVVMDSFSAIVQVVNFVETTKLVLKLQALAKKGLYVGLGVVHRGIHGKQNEFIVKHVSEGVIEFYTREENQNLKQFIRVTKMGLTKYTSTELPYIITKKGIEIID